MRGVFEGRRSASSISVRDDGGDIHAPLDQNVKVVLVTSPENQPIMDMFASPEILLR
jgi:hypothetical protein